jgi:hypothetical protein
VGLNDFQLTRAVNRAGAAESPPSHRRGLPNISSDTLCPDRGESKQ